jgi:hypothetical protein
MRSAAFGLLVCGILAAAGASADVALTDDEIRQSIIQQSIRAYRGVCACPESSDTNGHPCGARSGYSKPGGQTVMCHAYDVSDEQVKQYRRRHPAT